ncbi:Nn.00g023600.m01.CDS01 [Neocucurbitaria sp. VM-36]
MTKDHSQSGSSYTSSKDRMSSSPEQSSVFSKLSTSKHSPLAPEVARVEKRKANTLAARRYRQKRVDQMSSLETELKEVKTERDNLKVRCARLEGEVETLRALLRSQK